MRKGKNRICPECGKVCRPGGIGGHMRLKHGIKMKTVVKHVGDIRDDTRVDIRDARGDIRDARDVSDVRVQRPSDYLRKSDEVIEELVEPAVKPKIEKCEYCGQFFDSGHHNQVVPGKCLCIWCCIRFKRDKQFRDEILNSQVIGNNDKSTKSPPM
jgi:hypothetical protein